MLPLKKSSETLFHLTVPGWKSFRIERSEPQIVTNTKDDTDYLESSVEKTKRVPLIKKEDQRQAW